MCDVHVITYEPIGAGAEIARKFFAECSKAREGQWAVAKELGAEGYRPGYSGAIKSLLFNDSKIPAGFRKIGRDKGLTECVPHKGTKDGKAAIAAINAAPLVPQSHRLADEFGWEGRSPIDGRMIYHATAMKVALPAERFFVRLPRSTGDGWEVPETLRELPESDFMRAIEDHNAAVKEPA